MPGMICQIISKVKTCKNGIIHIGKNPYKNI